MISVNYVRLFTFLYCAAIACAICIRHADQLAYLRLTRPITVPARILHRWPVPRLTDTQFDSAGVGLVAALLLAAGGVMPTAFLLVSAGLFFIYFGQILSLSYVLRKVSLIPQILLLLAVAPGITRALGSAGPKWPLLLIQALLAQMYLSSGICKIRKAGISWGAPGQLQGILLQHHLTYDLPLAAKLARSRWICGILGYGALTLELTFWIALVAPRTAPYYALAGLALHVGAFFLMRIDYLTYHAPSYLVFAVPALAKMLEKR